MSGDALHDDCEADSRIIWQSWLDPTLLGEAPDEVALCPDLPLGGVENLSCGSSHVHLVATV
jgi:hypothetical protein